MGQTLATGVGQFTGVPTAPSVSDAIRASVSVSSIEKGEPKLRPSDVPLLHLESHLTYAMLSEAVYKASRRPPNVAWRGSSSSAGGRPPLDVAATATDVQPEVPLLPDGWEVYLHAADLELETDGYLGVAYIHRGRKHCVIAQRGTVDLSGLRAGVWMFFEEPSIVFFLAEQFSRAVRETLFHEFAVPGDGDDSSSSEESSGSDSDNAEDDEGLRHNGPKTSVAPMPPLPNGFRLSYTGHSLGAAIATVRAVEESVSAVTFESPGCRDFMERWREDKRRRRTAVQMMRRMRQSRQELELQRQKKVEHQENGKKVSGASSTTEQQQREKQRQSQHTKRIAQVAKQILQTTAPEALITNYLQFPNIINTLRPHVGYCLLLPLRSARSIEEAFFDAIKEFSTFSSNEGHEAEGSTSVPTREEEEEDPPPPSPRRLTRYWNLSDYRRMLPATLVPSPVGYVRGVLLSSMGMNEVVLELLTRLEAHLREMMDRTRQQHSVNTMVSYFQAYDVWERTRKAGFGGVAPPSTENTHPQQLPPPSGAETQTKDAVDFLDPPMEIIAWPQQMLQYIEYLNTTGALQDAKIRQQWHVAKSYRAMQQHFFDVRRTAIPSSSSTSSATPPVLPQRPLSSRYLPPYVVWMIDAWEYQMTPQQKVFLSLTALDHAVLNVVHLTAPLRSHRSSSGNQKDGNVAPAVETLSDTPSLHASVPASVFVYTSPEQQQAALAAQQEKNRSLHASSQCRSSLGVWGLASTASSQEHTSSVHWQRGLWVENQVLTPLQAREYLIQLAHRNKRLLGMWMEHQFTASNYSESHL